jgi:orotate phosphoribosyltransferase
MQAYQREFIEFAIRNQVLRFGEFTLKSGRVSPYFFNSGLFNSGASIARLGRYYAETIVRSSMACDMLFGPAYKGIPLAVAAAVALADHHGRDLPYAFNRKEVKDHGEGGLTVGAPLRGKILIVDDVISAGTSVAESIELIRAAGAQPAGVIVALDRQERSQGELSAIQDVEQRHGISVMSIINLEQIMSCLTEMKDMDGTLAHIRAYQRQYGTRDASPARRSQT